jgi:BioD-like phosphotransacetylase family protein
MASRSAPARVLLVEKVPSHDVPDGVLAAAALLGPRLGGVVFNWVRESESEPLEERIAPFLRTSRVPVFGSIPHDPLLSSVSVAEILETIGGVVLCGTEHLDSPVETFMVGAMGQEKALRFFRRKANKAVITGGDRADVQLAALETSTAALLLTGGQTPSAMVCARADELGVPVIMLEADTLDTVERMESIMGHVRLHGPGKADRIRAMFVEGVDVEALVGAFGF